MTERLQADDGMDRRAYRHGETGRISRGGVSDSIFRDAHHVDAETLLDLADGGLGVHSAATRALADDFEPLFGQPGFERVYVGFLGRVGLIQFLG